MYVGMYVCTQCNIILLITIIKREMKNSNKKVGD